jgi:YjbE family integral membrane protein
MVTHFPAEIFSADFFIALFSIIIIDLVMAGDNAIVISLAAKNLPSHMQRRIVFWGTFGAILIRALATLAAVWLLHLPGLQLIGGILLLWISVRMLSGRKESVLEVKDTVWGAVQTILIADTVMGMDNVLAVAGAAHGDYLLVGVGLVISVPIVLWGCAICTKSLERFPMLLYCASGILAFNAAKMIVSEPSLQNGMLGETSVKGIFMLGAMLGVIGFGYMRQRAKRTIFDVE